MTERYHFTHPAFTARDVAQDIGRALGRALAFQEPDAAAGSAGTVVVSRRVHVQVGADSLVVSASILGGTLLTWPPRPDIPATLQDILATLEVFPEVLP